MQADHVPGVGLSGKQAEDLREGGNLLWGFAEGPTLKRDVFAQFQSSGLFQESRKRYEPGWTTHDRVADPRFVRPASDDSATIDLRLQEDSPAINAGQSLPKEWPDPLRDSDQAQPDIGALPHGAELWGVGVDGRLPLFETK